MASYRVSNSARVGRRHRYVAAGVAYDCIANSPDGATCARRIIPVAACAFSRLIDADGVDSPCTTFPAGAMHDCGVQAFTCSVDCIVYW